MTCVSDEVAQYIASATTTLELFERLSEKLKELPVRCLGEASIVSGVSLSTFYGIMNGRAPKPKIDTLNAILKYMAPGYRVGLVPA